MTRIVGREGVTDLLVRWFLDVVSAAFDVATVSRKRARPGGYGVNQIAKQILDQVGGKLAGLSARVAT